MPGKSAPATQNARNRPLRMAQGPEIPVEKSDLRPPPPLL
jgi:hypothetical protein